MLSLTFFFVCFVLESQGGWEINVPFTFSVLFKGLSIGSLRTQRSWTATLDPSPIGGWRGKAVPWWTEWRQPSSGPTMEKPTCSVMASSGDLTKATRAHRWLSDQSQVTQEIAASGAECRPTWMTSSAGEKVHTAHDELLTKAWRSGGVLHF